MQRCVLVWSRIPHVFCVDFGLKPCKIADIRLFGPTEMECFSFLVSWWKCWGVHSITGDWGSRGFTPGLTRLGAWVGVACSLFRSSLGAAPDTVGRSLKPRPRTPPRLSPAEAASAQCRESLRPPGSALAQTLQLRAGSCSSSSSWHRERT